MVLLVLKVLFVDERKRNCVSSLWTNHHHEWLVWCYWNFCGGKKHTHKYTKRKTETRFSKPNEYTKKMPEWWLWFSLTEQLDFNSFLVRTCAASVRMVKEKWWLAHFRSKFFFSTFFFVHWSIHVHDIISSSVCVWNPKMKAINFLQINCFQVMQGFAFYMFFFSAPLLDYQ